MVKLFQATSFLVTITNCKPTRSKEDAIERIKSFCPAYKSLVIACEKHGKGDLHYHVFWNGKKKWSFAKTLWKPIRDYFEAANDDYKKWSKNTGITKKEWLVEKWRYCNNLVTSSFAEGKGDKKGQLWVYNDGDSYEDAQAQAVTELKPDADILKNFIDGESLTQQYQSADFTRMAYIAKNWDTLTKMIINYK